MPQLRLATFNCENLMMRCDYSKAGLVNARRQLTAIDNAALADRVDRAFDVLSEDDRTLTAQALVATGADICALQEVENLITLTAFDTRYVSRWAGRPFGERILFEGNDTRGIDVAALSKLPILNARSYADETYESLGTAPPPGIPARSRAFRRDCLELDVVKDGRALTLFIVHLKSMHGGRLETAGIRQAEASAIRALIERRFKSPAEAEWIILGDFNDYTEIDGEAVEDHGLGPLIDDGFAIDLAAMSIDDPNQRWSHHYAPGNIYGALDHMFLSPRLAAQNKQSELKFIRAGMPYRCQRHAGFRFPGIGWASPKASDHCPMVATIQFEGQPIPA